MSRGVAGHLVRTQPEDAAEAIEHVRRRPLGMGELSTLLGVLRSSEDRQHDTSGLAQLRRAGGIFTAV